MDSSPAPETRRRKRSQDGCVTCLQSKVKCTEERPRCRRCCRLDRSCTWREAIAPLRERRHGKGPLKSRDSYNPPVIRPKDSDSMSSVETPIGQSEPPTPESLQFEPPSTPDSWQVCCILSPSISAPNIPSSSSILMGQVEHEAVYYYETFLGEPVRKSLAYSVLGILKMVAHDRADMMHLLLAACLFEMPRPRSCQRTLHVAKAHFQLGCHMFSESLQSGVTSHSTAAMGFWLLQLVYRGAWDANSCVAMWKLSRAIADYITKHRLLRRLVVDEDLPGLDSSGLDQLSLAERSLTCRFLLLAAYEEVVPEMSLGGGELSSLILDDTDLAQKIFDVSQTSHETFFGSSYPVEELADDVERAATLELNFHAHSAISRLNRILRDGDVLVQRAPLEELLQDLKLKKRRYLNLFRLSEVPEAVKPSLRVSALSATARFLAAYDCVLGALLPVTLDGCLAQQFESSKKELISCIYLCMTNGPVFQTWRSQWPAYHAAVRAGDQIHTDWILQKMGAGSKYVQFFHEEQWSWDEFNSAALMF